MFHLGLLPQLYKIKHLARQPAFTSICGRMGRSKGLTEFEHGAVIGGQSCNKSVCEISSLLDIPRLTVSGIIEKWKCLGTCRNKELFCSIILP